MAKKTRIEDIDSEAVINSFRLDDTSIPPEARSAGGNAPSPPPKEATQEAAVSLPVPHYKEEPERRRRNGKLEKPDYDTVFIILDKMDKIGVDGVKAELVESGFAAEAADKYMSLFDELTANGNSVAWLAEKLGDFLEPEVSQNLSEIIDSVRATKASEFEITFDPTLVRGMSYYTGTIFEIAIPQFGGSCGGGGRYDKMVGKFTGKDVPACGFSIGFERIILLMMENGFQIPGQPKKIAYLIEKGVSGDRLCEVIAQAQEARKNGDQILVARMNKNKKFQKEQLTKEGYTDFVEFYKNPIEKQ